MELLELRNLQAKTYWYATAERLLGSIDLRPLIGRHDDLQLPWIDYPFPLLFLDILDALG
jgi:hypothetical protein